jgi:hypothetical protein
MRGRSDLCDVFGDFDSTIDKRGYEGKAIDVFLVATF